MMRNEIKLLQSKLNLLTGHLKTYRESGLFSEEEVERLSGDILEQSARIEVRITELKAKEVEVVGEEAVITNQE